MTTGSALAAVRILERGSKLIKRIILLVIISILSFSSSILAAEPGSGIIDGQVVNGTADGSSVADQEIILKTYLNNTEEDSTVTRTDDEGYFVFESLSIEPDYSYEVTLTFQQADYFAEQVSFGEGETSKFVDVIVYDSTTSDEAIKVMMSHVIIYAEQDPLLVKEYFLFVNDSDRTYIGSKEVSDGNKETLRFSLPSEAIEVQPDIGLMSCCIFGSEDGFVDTMPVLPGSKEVIYSYKLDYNSGAYTFSPVVNYPTANFNILVQGEVVRATSDWLNAEGPLDIEGILFQRLSGTDLVPGDVLTTRLTGLPEIDNQGTVIWVVVFLIVLVAGFSFFYLRRKGKLQPVRSGDNLEQKRQRLLAELAKLDDDFEGGQISEESYQKLRVAAKAQLVRLIQRAEEKSGNR